MADVFTVLAKDHQEVKNMLAELAKGPTRATGTSENQLALRKKMTQELIIEESKHEALEEMYFWPAVREHLTAATPWPTRRPGKSRKRKQVLADLGKALRQRGGFGKRSPSYVAARQHIEFEETRVWPGLRAALTRRRRPNSAPKSRTARGARPPGRIRTRPPRPAHSRRPGPWRRDDKVRDTITGEVPTNTSR